MSASASGSSAGKGDAKQRGTSHNDGSSTRAWTVDQKAAVVRVRKCAPTAFYDILGIEDVRTSVDENGIKKAYRKQSLLTHPDKNGYTGADEAFKMVSRAFQILGDVDKRRMFDQTGGDPDSRGGGGGGGGAAASPFSGFARGPGMRQGGFEAEISPEDLFRQFFGGGGGGGFGGPFGELYSCKAWPYNVLWTNSKQAAAVSLIQDQASCSISAAVPVCESINLAEAGHNDDHRASDKIPTHLHGRPLQL